MLINKDGRHVTVRTAEEVLGIMRDDFERMSPKEKECILQILSDIEKDGKSVALEIGEKEQYEEVPIPMEQWMTDDYYFGRSCEGLWECVRKDLIEIFTGDYNEAILSGAIGWGKSTEAEIAMCRQLYEIGCLRNPQRTYGLRAGSTITVMNMSVSERLAQRVVFDSISESIQLSPWFQKNFKPERTKDELRFPKNIWVTCGSSSPHSSLGLDIISCVLDETNFMGELSREQRASHVRWEHIDNAHILYASIKRRIKSRFEKYGRLPGILMLVSSKRTTTDFTERRILEAKEEKHVFVSERAIWEAKPEQYIDSPRFKVMVGNENTGSKIVETEDDLKDAVEKECKVIDVPIDFKSDAERDLEGFLRDCAGVATVSIYPFIRKRERIDDAIDCTVLHPLDNPAWVFGSPLDIKWDKLVSKADGIMKPIVNPSAVRHIHIDPSLTGDAAGFCVGHVERYIQIKRKDPLNVREEIVETAPIIVIDFLLKIIPPPGGEIVIGDLRSIVYDFHEHGFQIGFVSMDSYIRADPIQILNSKGFKAAHVSMDTAVQPYQCLKDCIYEKRLRMYKYQPVIDELKGLEFNLRKRKVDHPTYGEKDVADSLGAVVYTLSNRSYAEMPVTIFGRRVEEDAVRSQLADVVKKSSNGKADAVDLLMSDDDDTRDLAQTLLM